MSAAPDRAIDTHAHVYPATHLDRIEALGVDPATTKIARGLGADSTPEDMGERLRWMDTANVETQVLSAMPQGAYGPAAGAAEATRLVNDEYAVLLDRYPGRFLAYGSLPLPHAEESIAEVRRVLIAPGFVGITIPTVFPDGATLSDPRLDPIWAELEAQRTVVNIHPTGSGACSHLIADAGLAWVNGAPVEDAIAVLHLLKADVPGRFPSIRFHIAHLGGDLPFLAQRIEDNYEDWGAFVSSPGASLRRMWFDAANFHEPSLRLAAETFGVSRVMAGSDHPYFQRDKYVRAFDYVRGSRLDESDRARILSGNARALYGGTSG
ncbi:amidohydrolase [Rhodococcus sp. D2-41]|uniref:amidohydrolase family protein n=1 Tax=Speluncibacter jeojiensis TaxID=2710754 RepID=UPI00240EF731|nr:amidohydrolase family protein [Rhodococcus sp. D2-41]MDG3009837.1 amidohydrolase [Rhodococcus sp. D2-41]